MGTLDGKGALVTGGSRGIGRAIVARLVAEGAQVVFSYHSNTAAAEEVAKETGARAVQADQASRDDVERLFATAEKQLPSVDVLVNNAAETGPALVADVDDETYDRVMAANVKAVFLAVQWAVKVMRDGGRIINISTLNTVVPSPTTVLYAASKGAVEQITKVAARELGGRGITVNTVSPGATDTDMLRGANPPEALEQTPSFTALGRLGRPDDIAAVVAFLAGPDGRWMTGQNLRATGGLLV